MSATKTDAASAVRPANAEVFGDERSERILVGDVVAGEHHGGRMHALAQRGDSRVLALVAERVLDDVVARPATPVRGFSADDRLDGVVCRGGRRGIRSPRVHAEPERLRLDPDAVEAARHRFRVPLQLIAQSDVGRGVLGFDRALPRDPILCAVRAREKHRRVVGVLGDDPQIGERPSRHERDCRIARRQQRVDRRARHGEHAGGHRVVHERREGAVEVERHE